MKKAKFAMAFHCYQPVFNFEREIEHAFKNAYLPLTKMLERFPGIKASFHYSGNMLEWFEFRHPDYLKNLKELVQRGQVEIISGCYYEPIMVLIPERDRKEQLRMNEAIITRIFGVRPRGAWIAERVWEPALADTLASAGMEYTIVDDYHLLHADAPKEKIFSPCLTRGESGSIILFPALTKLRYSMPFLPPGATLDYIRRAREKEHADTMCFFFADDGEKFGAWPYTHRWVYGKGWLRDFFILLEKNAEWLQTLTYSEVMDTVTPEAVRKIPESSYAEMMKWSGGNFRNFLRRYPEADRMHKRMLSLSDMIEEFATEDAPCAENTRLREAKKELFKAQSGCAYWHGTFGGVYLPHLRSGVYRHLIKAQNIISTAREKDTGHIRTVEHDLGDGKRETVIENGFVNVFVKPFEGGGVSELDYKPLNLNLINTMSRIREVYHKKLGKNYFLRIKVARRSVACGNIVDIHDILGLGERGLRKILCYDDYRRNSFLTHIYGDKKPWREAPKGRGGDDGFLKGAYTARTESNREFIAYILSRRGGFPSDSGMLFDLEVTKEITVGSSPAVMFTHRISKHAGGTALLRYAVEFNFLIWDRAVLSRPRLARTDRFSLKDRYSDISLDFFLDRKFTVFRYPVYTVNETERGLKKTFQGVSVLIGDDQFGSRRDTSDMKMTVVIG